MTIGMVNCPTLTPIGKVIEIATRQTVKRRVNTASSQR